MAAFTHYWTNRTCDSHEEGGWAGRPLEHTAGKGFRQRGVKEGDRIYVVTVWQGRLYLIGRLTVDRIITSDAEARRVLGYEPWSAPEHLVASDDGTTLQQFDREVPGDVARQLRFESKDGPKPLLFSGENGLDQQTLRGIRKLTPGSAAILEALLK